MTRFGTEKAQGSEEINLCLGILFQDASDAVVDAAALGVELFRVKIVFYRIVFPGAAFPVVVVIVGRGPEYIDVIDTGRINLLLQADALV